MMHAVRPGAFERVQLGAGVFLLDLNLDGVTGAAEARTRIAAALCNEAQILGMTRGGGTFRCAPSVRFAEADGQRMPSAGAVHCNGWQVTLSGTLVELKPAAWQALLPGAVLEETENAATLSLPESCGQIAPLKRLTWVGDTGAGLLAIELRGVVATSGAALRFVDREEGTLPFTFEATQAEGEEAVPVKIYFLRE